MTIQFNLSVEAKDLVARLGNRAGLGQSIARAMDRENELTLNLVRAKLSGAVLNRVTGRLRDSMQRTDAIVINDGTSLEVRSSLGSNVRFGGQSVVYAAIHEHGGTTRPHVIRAKAGGYLAFPGRDGNTVFRKSVNHPGSKIPARPYLRPSIEERRENYNRSLSTAAVQFLGGAK